MSRFCITGVAALCVSFGACSPEVVETSTDEQAYTQQQGTQLQGTQLQGASLQGMTMQGFQFAGATLNDGALANVHVQQGELVADQNQVTLHGASLINAHLYAQMRNPAANPPTSAV